MSFRDRAINRLYAITTTPHRWRTVLSLIIMTLFLPFFASLIYLATRIDSALGVPQLFSLTVGLILSLPCLCLGLIFMLWSAFYFLRARGTPVPINPPAELVITGPYAYSRNPMMSGFLLAIWGCGLILGSLTTLCFLAPLLTGLALWEIKAIEEPELEKRFGKAYLDYKQRTPMIIPRWKPRS